MVETGVQHTRQKQPAIIRLPPSTATSYRSHDFSNEPSETRLSLRPPTGSDESLSISVLINSLPVGIYFSEFDLRHRDSRGLQSLLSIDIDYNNCSSTQQGITNSQNVQIWLNYNHLDKLNPFKI